MMGGLAKAESASNSNKISLDIDETVETLRIKYKIPDKFKKAFVLDREWDFYKKLAMKGKFEGDTGWIWDEKLDHKSGVLVKDNYAVVCKLFYNGESVDQIYFIFAKDWETVKNEFYSKTVNIRPGLYEITSSGLGWTLKEVELGNITKPILNDDLFTKMRTEINHFNENESFYKEHKLDYKRGILLYGLPGNGKTNFIKYLLHDMKALTLIVDAKNEEQIKFSKSIITGTVLKDVLKIVVLEDIDGVDPYSRSVFLNMLDGIVPLNKVIFIATTNFPKRLDSGIINRPSRFDVFIEVASPNVKSRQELIKSFFPSISAKELVRAAAETEGFKGVHFKEVFLLSKFYNTDVFGAIEKIKIRFKDFASFKGTEEGQDYIG